MTTRRQPIRPPQKSHPAASTAQRWLTTVDGASSQAVFIHHRLLSPTDARTYDTPRRRSLSSQPVAAIMASSSHFVQLAKTLPSPLQRFFARWPPAAILPEGAAAKPTPYQEQRPNPFRFYKHPVTGKWQDPVYSQRRQAELVQLAREHGVEELLPETTKGTEYRLAYRVEHGLRVKGTGVGQKVKGHIHERHMIAKYVVAVALDPRGMRRMLTNLCLGWRRGGKPCWRCPSLSRPGRRYAIPPVATGFPCSQLS